MALKGFERVFSPLQLLAETQVEEIHRGTLRVLAETGVAFHDRWALEFLEAAGQEEQHRPKAEPVEGLEPERFEAHLPQDPPDQQGEHQDGGCREDQPALPLLRPDHGFA